MGAQHEVGVECSKAHSAGRADRLVERARRGQPERQGLEASRQLRRVGDGLARQAFVHQREFDAFDPEPAAEVAGERARAARMRDLGGDPLCRMRGQKVEPQRGLARLFECIAQRCGQGVDQAAFDAGCGDHELALAIAAAVRGQHCGDGFHRVAGVAGGEVFAPGDIKTAVGRAEGGEVDPEVGERRRPATVRAEFGPTGAPQGEDDGCGLCRDFASRRGKAQAVAQRRFFNALPAVAHVDAQAAIAQAVQPGAQERRGLHAGGKNAA